MAPNPVGDIMVELQRWNPTTRKLESHGRCLATTALQALNEEAALASLAEALRWSNLGATLHLIESMPPTRGEGCLQIGALDLAQTISAREGGAAWHKIAYWEP